MTNTCVFVQGTQVSSSCTEIRNKKDLETTLRAFENNINQIIEDDPPEGILEKYAGKDNLFAVPIAVLIGVPLYSNVMAIIPIIESLIERPSYRNISRIPYVRYSCFPA